MIQPPALSTPPGAAHASLRGLVAKLTLLFWALLFVTFACTIAATGHGAVPAWIWLWLVAIALTGMAWSVGLAFFFGRVAGAEASKRWLALLAAVMVATAGQTILDGALQGLISGVAAGRGTALPGLEHYVLNAIIYLWVFGFNVVALALVGELNRSVVTVRREAATALDDAARRERAAKVREQAGKAQLEALRFQIDPHFLFNTLNGISSLVLAGRPEAAEAMIQKFVDYLRHALKETRDGLVTLDRELTSSQAYLAVEGARFDDAVTVDIDCPAALRDALVPNFILRPLLERAVRHATDAGRPDDIQLTVSPLDTGLKIDICCAGPLRTDGQTPRGFELVQARLDGVYGPAARFLSEPTPSGLRVQLYLPLIRDVETFPC